MYEQIAKVAVQSAVQTTPENQNVWYNTGLQMEVVSIPSLEKLIKLHDILVCQSLPAVLMTNNKIGRVMALGIGPIEDEKVELFTSLINEWKQVTVNTDVSAIKTVTIVDMNVVETIRYQVKTYGKCTLEFSPDGRVNFKEDKHDTDTPTH